MFTNVVGQLQALHFCQANMTHKKAITPVIKWGLFELDLHALCEYPELAAPRWLHLILNVQIKQIISHLHRTNPKDLLKFTNSYFNLGNYLD